MGNCVSQTGRKEFLKNLQNITSESFGASDDPQAFQVFVKKRNKFIPGTLRVTQNEIVFIRSRSDALSWPLHFLRRYGFTSAGIFFFESGRRCTSGEGIHTFQSHQAEAIFQLVQTRIQANANVGFAVREARAPSVAGSLRSVHNIPPPYPGTRIQPIQRYSSEGTASVDECFPPSYNSCRRPSNRFNSHRHVVVEGYRRPRSIAGPANHTAIWPVPPPSYHPHRLCSDRPAFIGSVVSEHIIQRQPSESSSCDHSYINLLPQRRSATSSPQCLSPALRGYSSARTFGSQFNNSIAASHRIPATVNPQTCEKLVLNRYVNTSQDTAAIDREATPSQLDYASLTVGHTDESLPGSIRSQSSVRAVSNATLMPSNVNYTKIDLDKTHAVEVAASALEKENPLRRYFPSHS